MAESAYVLSMMSRRSDMETKQEYVIGDCLDVMKTYPANFFDLILTDPPYGINIANNGKVGGDGGNFNYAAKDYTIQTWDKERLSIDFFKEMLRVSENQIIFGGNYYLDYLPSTPCFIVWDKDNSGNFADCELAWTSFDTATRLFKYRWNGMLQGNMKKKEERVHPTQKPVPLFEWILKNYAKEGNLILDPFCGSGTILEACLNLNMNCLAIDKSDQWEEHYKKRLRKHDSKLDAWF